MHPTQVLRQGKHRLFVARKRARVLYRRGKFGAATTVLGPLGQRLPYTYRPGRYSRGKSGLPWMDADQRLAGPSEFPRRVFAVWTGDNPLSEARQRSLDVLADVIGVGVTLVTPANLNEWLVPDHPLHPAYENLSLVHRSDYLRGYLLHHHGGGYVDVKVPNSSWVASFETMEADRECWVTSYPTTDANWIGKLPGRMGRHLLLRHRLLFGKGALLMRSHTPLTGEWLAQMNSVLTARAEALAQNPGGVFGDVDDYPLSWTDLLGRILDPLTLKYHGHVRFDERLLLRFEDYR